MSFARKCDRCNKLFEPKETCNGHKNVWSYLLFGVTTRNGTLSGADQTYDLCDDCKSSFESWISAGNHDAEIRRQTIDEFLAESIVSIGSGQMKGETDGR